VSTLEFNQFNVEFTVLLVSQGCLKQNRNSYFETNFLIGEVFNKKNPPQLKSIFIIYSRIYQHMILLRAA